MQQSPYSNYSSDDIKLTDVIRSFRTYSLYVFRKFWVVLIGMLLFATAGYFYATTAKTKYQANASFNVVDSKGMGGLGGFLGGFGMMFGGSTSNEVLAGIIQSRHAIKSAFLTEVDYKGGKEKLIDVYLIEYGVRADWQEYPDLANFEFISESIHDLTRKEDSLLNTYWKPFVEDYLDVEFEILEGLIKTSVKTYSYEFSVGMLTNMLEYSSKYFLDKQSFAETSAYEVANYRVDSIVGLLSAKRVQLAQEQNKSPFLADAVDAVALNKLAGEVSNLTIRLGTAREALDAAKTAVMQSSPVINIIDHPSYATDIKIKKWKLWTIIGALVGIVLSVIILLLNKAAIDGFESERLQQDYVDLN